MNKKKAGLLGLLVLALVTGALGRDGAFLPAEAAVSLSKEAYAREFADAGHTAILVEKSQRRLTVFYEGKELKSYPCAFGVNPDGDKQERGDNRTPEGRFFITDKERLGNHPYLGRTWLGLSYPDVGHAERGLQAQRISYGEYRSIVEANQHRSLPPQDTLLGGWIGIHGGRDEATRAGTDWTEGCIAMVDSDLEEIYPYVAYGTAVVVVE